MYADTFSENDTRKINLKQIFAGASVYFNYTGNAKCFDMGTADDIGSSMWDYQVRMSSSLVLNVWKEIKGL